MGVPQQGPGAEPWWGFGDKVPRRGKLTVKRVLVIMLVQAVSPFYACRMHLA